MHLAMPELEIALLGSIQVRLTGNLLTNLPTKKAQALLAYLAVEANTAHARERLALLLWPDQPRVQSFDSLRQSLHLLRKIIPSTYLHTTRLNVAFNLHPTCHLDVAIFSNLLADCHDHNHRHNLHHRQSHSGDGAACIERLQQAVLLYRGDFLEHFALPESETFEEWVWLKRGWLKHEALNALFQLAEHYTEEGDYELACQYAWRQVELDAPREEAHRQLMRALALQGRRSEALEQYESCRRILADMVNVEPDPETVALYRRVRNNDLIAENLSGSQPPVDIKTSVMPSAARSSGIDHRLDWGEAPDVETFYGRATELAALDRWVMTDQCRLVGIFGMGGIGKTTLATKLCVQVQERFEYLIWRSLRNAPPIEEIVAQCIRFLSDQKVHHLPTRMDQLISLLIDLLRQHRCLLLLDNFEAILQDGAYVGQYRAGYEAYGQMIQRLGEARHQSCLVLTSREKPQEFALLHGSHSPMRAFVLTNLGIDEGQALLQDKGLVGSSAHWASLIAHYSGNPLALQIVSETIQDLYAGEIGQFLREETAIFGGIQELLTQQFDRLSALEQEILYWLAIEREPTTIEQLVNNLVAPVAKRELLAALHSLHRRSMIEKNQAGFTLQNVVMEYVTTRLVAQICREIEAGAPVENRNIAQLFAGAPDRSFLDDDRLDFNRFSLLQAQAKEYVRESQSRLILRPVNDHLLGRLGQTGRVDRLKALLIELQQCQPRRPGYAGGNLINLLIDCGTDISGYDFSRLTIWQAYLRGVALNDVNFTGADLGRALFTDSFGAITYLAVSPNGKLLAAGTYDGEIRVWQISDYRLSAIMHQSSPVWCVAFSPDSQALASCGGEQTIYVWDVQTNQIRYQLQGHKDWVWRLSFSADGETLASGGSDCTIRLWNMQTGQASTTFQGHTAAVLSVQVSADGQMLASASSDETVRLWDIASGQARSILRGHTNLVGDVAISPNGQMIASAGYDQTVRLWQVSDGSLLHVFQGHTNRVTSVAFSPDNKLVISGSGDHNVCLWQISTGQIWRVLQGHSNLVDCAVFSPDGETVFSGSYDQTVRQWDVKSGQLRRTIHGHTNWMAALAFAPDGKSLATGSYDQLVRLWDIETGQLRRMLRGHRNWIHAVAFSPDGQFVASGGIDQTIRLWDAGTGHVNQILLGHTSWVTALAFSPDGKTLASGSVDQTIRLWDVGTGQLRQTLQGHAAIWSVAISQDGQWLASCGYEEAVRLWDLATGQFAQMLQGHTSWVDCLAFSPVGNLLASGGHDQTIQLWDLATKQSRYTLCGHTNRVAAVAFSPDGEILVSGSDDHTVCLWDVGTGKLLRTDQGHTNGVTAVDISPDGQVIASSSADETIKLWDLQNGICLNTLGVDGPYARMNISRVTGLTESQVVMLKALGAVED